MKILFRGLFAFFSLVVMNTASGLHSTAVDDVHFRTLDRISSNLLEVDAPLNLQREDQFSETFNTQKQSFSQTMQTLNDGVNLLRRIEPITTALLDLESGKETQWYQLCKFQDYLRRFKSKLQVRVIWMFTTASLVLQNAEKSSELLRNQHGLMLRKDRYGCLGNCLFGRRLRILQEETNSYVSSLAMSSNGFSDDVDEIVSMSLSLSTRLKKLSTIDDETEARKWIDKSDAELGIDIASELENIQMENINLRLSELGDQPDDGEDTSNENGNK